ncbi:hypothetical protein [Chondrinema litorale]|uniref:hypothetical protein n=1 Tax=Chondrinema litorale TaxID=2994555 RepID=UPI002542DCEF|nr:hypothetical protein [Chondrinema litorale]UZR99532.1 hypothetical protein OQ292_36685 [Chondrinema litorale]
MLKIQYQDKSFELPLSKANLLGSFSLDEDWQQMDYKHGDSALNLCMLLSYRVPTSYLTNNDFIWVDAVDQEETALINLELEINHTDFDLDNKKTRVLGEILLFPSLTDLQNQQANQSILQDSTLWFPAYANPTQLNKINFGKIIGNQIEVTCSGDCVDINGKMSFTFTEQVDFVISSEIEGYPENFQDFTIQDRFAEIKNCFATIYNIDKYTFEERVKNELTKNVCVDFKLKDSNS